MVERLDEIIIIDPEEISGEASGTKAPEKSKPARKSKKKPAEGKKQETEKAEDEKRQEEDIFSEMPDEEPEEEDAASWLERMMEEDNSPARRMLEEKRDRDRRLKEALPPHIYREWKSKQNSSWGSQVGKIPFGKYIKPGDDINEVCGIFDSMIVGRENEKGEILRKYASFCISGRMKRPILLVGDPGCGKSCFAKCMAKATGFPIRFINMPSINSPIALVGTEQHYSNSRVGELTKAVIDEGTLSVVFVLDEIDKIVTNSNEGSVESVLLTLFDPVWNGVFVDRSLDVPIDMSHCVFICTANSISDMSEPLLDRMDIIRFESYTEEQAAEILGSKTMPGCLGEYGMNEKITFAPGMAQAVVELLDNGSMRDYEKIVEKLVDNAIFNILRSGRSSYIIRPEDIETIMPGEKRKSIGFGC